MTDQSLDRHCARAWPQPEQCARGIGSWAHGRRRRARRCLEGLRRCAGSIDGAPTHGHRVRGRARGSLRVRLLAAGPFIPRRGAVVGRGLGVVAGDRSAGGDAVEDDRAPGVLARAAGTGREDDAGRGSRPRPLAGLEAGLRSGARVGAEEWWRRDDASGGIARGRRGHGGIPAVAPRGRGSAGRALGRGRLAPGPRGRLRRWPREDRGRSGGRLSHHLRARCLRVPRGHDRAGGRAADSRQSVDAGVGTASRAPARPRTPRGRAARATPATGRGVGGFESPPSGVSLP